jgi:hypothetical protein
MAVAKRSNQHERGKIARIPVASKEVPLQVMVPERIRREVALLCASRRESLRTTVLRGLRAVGIEVPESELVDRRGRRKG